jgi:hypothetical protein
LSANVDFNWMAFAAAVSERMPGGCQIVETTITAGRRGCAISARRVTLRMSLVGLDGAAKRTIGTMTAQEVNHDSSPNRYKWAIRETAARYH